MLQLPTVSVTDDFFVLGGDSLAAVRLCMSLGEHLGTEIPVRFLLDYPTIAAAAEHLLAKGVTPRSAAAPTAPAPSPAPSVLLHTTTVPLLTQLATASIRPVDAVAVAAIPSDLPQSFGLDAAGFVNQWMNGQPLWAQTYDTALGRIGVILLRASNTPNQLIKLDFPAAQKLAQELRASIDNPKPFDMLAAVHSADAKTKVRGGDSGWHHAIDPEFPPEALAEAFAMKLGEVSQPILVVDGVVLVKVLAIEPPPGAPLLKERLLIELEDQYRDALLLSAKIEFLEP